jgi:hypothetical protein
MLSINSPVTMAKVVDPSEHNVSRVNSIKGQYPDLRQESKVPTFCSDL